jgi:hypothetical protein
MKCRVFIVLALSLMLSGCATTPPDPRFLALLAALKSSNVEQVVLEVAPEVLELDLNLDGVDLKKQFQDYAENLRPRLSQLVGRPGGETPARLVVRLRGLSMASSAGRTLVGSDSLAAMAVRLENLKTKAVIAEENIVIARDAGTKGGGNLGFVIALVANSASAAYDVRIEKIATSTVLQLDRWLTFGEAIAPEVPRPFATQVVNAGNGNLGTLPAQRSGPAPTTTPKPATFSPSPLRR